MEVVEGRRLCRRVLRRVSLAGRASSRRLRRLVHAMLSRTTSRRCVPLDSGVEVKHRLFGSFHGLSILRRLLRSSSVARVVMGKVSRVFCRGRKEVFQSGGYFLSRRELLSIVRRVMNRSGHCMGRTSPVISTELGSKSQMGIMLGPITIGKPVLAVQGFPSRTVAVRRLVHVNDMASSTTGFLGGLMTTGCGVFIDNKAKTKGAAFLGTLSGCVPGKRHLVAVRSGTRLRVRKIRGLIHLRTHKPGTRKRKTMAVESLVGSTLHVEPSQVIMKRMEKRRAMSVVSSTVLGNRDNSVSAKRTGGPASVLRELRAVVLVKVSLPLRTVRERITSTLSVVVRLKELQSGAEGILRVMRIRNCRNKEVRAGILCRFGRRKVGGKGVRKYLVGGGRVAGGRGLLTTKCRAV